VPINVFVRPRQKFATEPLWAPPTVFDPGHYVPAPARKPGALRNGVPLKDWVCRLGSSEFVVSSPDRPTATESRRCRRRAARCTGMSPFLAENEADERPYSHLR
jgi:hypothetical protein